MIALLLLACVPRARYAELETAYVELEAENAALTADNAALTAENATLKETNAALSAENALLESTFSRPRPTLASLDPESVEARCVMLEEGRYTLDRDPAVLRQGFESFGAVARFVPHKNHDKEVDGYRISGIRPHTLLDSCGVRNGDVLMAIDGKPLNSISATMEVYQGLEGVEQFTMSLVRRSVPMELVFVRPD